MNENILLAIKKLKDAGIPYRVLEFPDIARKSEDVARMSNVNPKEIVKTLLVKMDDDKVHVLILPGMKRLDNKKVRKLLKTKNLRMLNEDELEENSPFAPGEVCPILLGNIETFIDKTVFETEKINTGSGDLYFGLEFPSKALLKFLKAKIVDIVE